MIVDSFENPAPGLVLIIVIFILLSETDYIMIQNVNKYITMNLFQYDTPRLLDG